MTDLIERYLDHLRGRRADRTIELRRYVLTRMDRELPCGLLSASVGELYEWIYREDFEPNTRACYHNSAASFYQFVCRPPDPGLSFNPMDLLPRPAVPRGLPRFVTDAQLARILAELGEPYRTWAVVAAHQGARCCEIAGMDREHITPEETTIFKGKGGKARIVPTHPVTWSAVRDLPPGPIARRVGDGARLHRTDVSTRAGRHLREIVGEPCGLHRLRHWFGTTLRRAGVDLDVIADLMGHASTLTTQIYAQVPDGERRLAIRALPTLTDASW